jgi:hypothetical protein
VPKAKSVSAKLVGENESAKTKEPSNDLLMKVAHEVENLTKAQAFALADEVIARAGQDDFLLGGILAVIHDRSMAEGGEAWLDGHSSFADLVSARFGFEYRKAAALISIYKNLTEKQIPWDTVKDMGWAKLGMCASLLTPKNAEQWAEKAKKYNADQFRDIVRKAKAGKSGTDAVAEETTATKRLSVLLHGDQYPAVRKALDKVKKETGTEFDSVALFNLAQGYLGNSVEITTVDGNLEEAVKGATKKQKSAIFLTLLKELGPDQSLELFDKCYGSWHITAKSPDQQEEEREEAKKLGIKYDPATFEVEKALKEFTGAPVK